MMFVGIDPGIKGGICFVNRQGQIEHMEPMKTPEKLAALMKASKNLISGVCLEKSQACRPGQSTKASFTYGVGYGMIRGILLAHAIPYELVSPRTWQKTMIIPSSLKDPKAKALHSANKVFKKNKAFWLPTKRHRKPHDGIIDSALLAEYCRIIHHGEK